MTALARRLHRLVLRLYPPELRERWEASMRATFEDVARDEGELRALGRELGDALRTAPRLRLEALRERRARRRPLRIDPLLKDFRYAVRGLRRSPGFTLVAVVSLALGIGVNAAIIGLLDGLLFRPMPVEAPDRLVAIYATRGADRFPLNFSYPNYRDVAAARDVFEDVVGFQGAALSFDAETGRPELLWSEVVTPNYFSGLGVGAAIGRLISPADDDDEVAVLSYALWQRRFDGSAAVLGRPIRINGHELTVVGVARRGFTGAKFLGFTPELWVPVGLHEIVWPGVDDRLTRRSGGWLNLRARLAPGVSFERAEAALTTLAARLENAYPDVNEDWRLHLMPAPRKVEPVFQVQLGGMLPVASGLLLGVVGIVLLVACANVASLQLARSLGRQREVAIRLSLGATRATVARQLVLESLVLSALGLLGGLWLGRALLRAALELGPRLDFHVDFGASVDGRVVAVTAVLALAAGLLSGLLPALRTSRRDVSRTLRESGVMGRAGALRRWIVVPQIALSLVALVAAGLLLSSFENAAATSPGFRTQGVLLASVNLDLQGYGEEDGKAFLRSLVERLRSQPGVEGASLAFPLPLDAFSEGDRVFPEGADDDAEGTLVLLSVVGQGYFDVMETPIVAGRSFDASDENGRRVAIVNETLARKLWAGEGAVGRRMRLGRDGPSVEIVGVARDGKYVTLGEEPRPYFFLPLAQQYAAPVTILVSAEAPPRSLEPVVRAEIARLDPTLPVYGVKTMEEFIGRSLAGARALAVGVSAFAALALVLATVGVYGLMSFLVSSKRQELGIRMALGAGRGRVLRLFLAEAGRLAAAGLAVGLALAWLAARTMSSLLFAVSPTSPLVYAAVSLGVLLVALAGAYLPSRRASRLDPLATLRHE